MERILTNYNSFQQGTDRSTCGGQQDRIEPGQEFEIERIDSREYLLRRKSRRRNEALVNLLLACPVKSWFLPLDRSETTDDIAAPKLG